MNNSKILELHKYLIVNSLEIKEIESIDIILEAIINGRATDIIAAAGLAKLNRINLVKQYFKEHPGKYIFILGSHAVAKNIIFKKANTFGIDRKQIKFFDEYQQLKNHNAMNDVGKKDVVAIILGHVPHSAKGIEGYSSLKQAIEANIDPKKVFASESLKLSKSNLHTFFAQIANLLCA